MQNKDRSGINTATALHKSLKKHSSSSAVYVHNTMSLVNPTHYTAA